MKSEAIRKKKPRAENDFHAQHDAIRAQTQAQISASAGLTQSGNLVQDPIYHLSSQLTQNFDEVGRRKNAERHKNDEHKNESETIAQRRASGDKRELNDSQINELRKRHDSPVYSHTAKQLQNGDFCDRFSNYAFTNGNLAASVFTGTSKAVFTSCLCRGAMRRGTERDVQKGLNGGKTKNVPLDGQPAGLIFNNSSINKDVGLAAGIVVDSIRSSIRVMDIFKQLVADSGSQPKTWLERRDVTTLKQMYPFLNTDEDDALIAKYSAELKQLGNDSTPEGLSKRRVFDAALKKAEAVKSRKLSEQRKFLTKLEEMLNNAREAEKMFLSDEFLSEAEEAVRLAYDTPPEDNNRNILGDILLGAAMLASEAEHSKQEESVQEQTEKQPQTAADRKKADVKRRKQRTENKPKAESGEAEQ
ncbi:MAG: hypothetical protein ACI4KM_11180 [Oscillospiraceae bacterium]